MAPVMHSIIGWMRPMLSLPAKKDAGWTSNPEVLLMHISFHAQQRIQQRGMTGSDIDLILTHGTETRDGYFLRDQDIKKAEAELRKQIEHIHRLAGKFIVVDGETIVTAYHPARKKQKRILRN